MKQANWNPEREGMSVAEYKRMVSYMYQYENGVKKKNVGFARVEAKDGQCKITLHMQLLGQLDSIFPTYLLQRKYSELELIYLGDTFLKNQVMDSKLVTEESNIMKSGYPLSDMGGLLLFLNDNIFFATEWDDKPILASEVQEALKPKTDRVPKMTLEEELLIPKYKLPRGFKTIERLQQPEAYYRAGIPKAEARPEKVELTYGLRSNEEPEDIKLAGTLGEITQAASIQAIDTVEQAQEMTLPEEHSDRGEISDEISLASEEIKLEAIEASMEATEEFMEATEESMEVMEESMEEVREEASEEAADPQVVTGIFEKHPRIYPFEDNEIIICAKIEPKDIGLFPKELWALSNNSFLIHGYYCYHHLIFAKMKDRFGCRYILGVPGIYHNREMFMAKMFGFDGFKPIRKRELRQGDFGYWYTSVCF